MPRIIGVDIPKEKRIEIALTYIHGVGRSTSNRILKAAGVNPDTRAKKLSEEEIFSILHRMLKEDLIGHYMWRVDKYALFSGNICSDSWFTTTEKGKKEYNQSVERTG